MSALTGGFAAGSASAAPQAWTPQKMPRLRSTPRAEAEARAQAFALRRGGGAFKALSRAQVARGAIDRLHDPNRIQQGASSLCGPSALLRSVASVDPVAYVDYITQLFEFGRARLGKLEVEPGEDLREYDPGNQLDHADWIGLASLRDSENFFFDYDEVDDQVGGITLPSHLEGWFREAGFTRVINDTNLIVDKDVANIRAANELYKQNYWVCLFINANMLTESDMLRGSFSANHWVVLSSRVQLLGDQISCTVFTWGQGFYRMPPVGKTVSVDSFLDNYYGYVAAKY